MPTDEERRRNRDAVRKYQAAHPERVLAQGRRRYAANPEKKRKLAREYAAANRERARETARRWNAANPERKRKNDRKRQKANPDKARANSARRRAIKKGNGGSYTVTEWQTLCAQYNNQCIGPGPHGGGLQADHVVPLKKGGTGNITNIQPLCSSCNGRKGTKTIDYR